jgi:hypothetical protein
MTLDRETKTRMFFTIAYVGSILGVTATVLLLMEYWPLGFFVILFAGGIAIGLWGLVSVGWSASKLYADLRRDRHGR